MPVLFRVSSEDAPEKRALIAAPRHKDTEDQSTDHTSLEASPVALGILLTAALTQGPNQQHLAHLLSSSRLDPDWAELGSQAAQKHYCSGPVFMEEVAHLNCRSLGEASGTSGRCFFWLLAVDSGVAALARLACTNKAPSAQDLKTRPARAVEIEASEFQESHGVYTEASLPPLLSPPLPSPSLPSPSLPFSGAFTQVTV